MATQHLRITVDGKTYDVLVETLDGSQPVPVLQPAVQTVQPVQAAPAPVPAAVQPAVIPAASPAPAALPAPASAGEPVPSPLSGTIIDIHVKEGQAVQEGDLLITLEAMKMNTPVNAPKAGKVASILVQKGAAVDEGSTLITIA